MRTQRLTNLLTYQGIPLWRDVRVIRAVSQILSAIIVVSLVAFFVSNLINAANSRGISLGFDFLGTSAGFPISESILEYDEADSYLYAFGLGILNTLKVALVGIVLATALGLVVGVARLSSNWLIRTIAGVYIESIRNVPLLVQLFFWYFGVFQLLPLVRESITLPGPIFFSNRGVFLPWANPTPTFSIWFSVLFASILVATAIHIVLTRRQSRTGRPSYPLVASVALVIAVPLVAWFVLPQSPLTKEIPVLGRFNFGGGLRLTPEFSALLAGLVFYTGTFIAEIVRSGIQSVNKGQVEAAKSLGLSNLQALRLVIFPQALRVIIPPLISQLLNLTKNSSLAIAIGFPDLFAVGRIMINQAGRAIPIFLMIMISYLAMSLTYSVIGNIYNRRANITER